MATRTANPQTKEWAVRVIRRHWKALTDQLDTWIPDTGKVLGCGHYGCVFATEEDPMVVFKLTTDPTEATFANYAIELQGSEPVGVVQYWDIFRLKNESFRHLPVFVILREAARCVGLQKTFNCLKREGKRTPAGKWSDMLPRMWFAQSYAAKARQFLYLNAVGGPESFRAYADWAERQLDLALGLLSFERDIKEVVPEYDPKDPYESLDKAIRVVTDFDNLRDNPKLLRQATARSLALCLFLCLHAYMELAKNRFFRDYANAVLEWLIRFRVLLADVHHQNLGLPTVIYNDAEARMTLRTPNTPIITDPGHAVFLDPRVERRAFLDILSF